MSTESCAPDNTVLEGAMRLTKLDWGHANVKEVILRNGVLNRQDERLGVGVSRCDHL